MVQPLSKCLAGKDEEYVPRMVHWCTDGVGWPNK